MEQFTLRLKKEILDKLRSEAKKRDRSLNYIINEYIKAGLKDHE